jgi:phage minor structural protein
MATMLNVYDRQTRKKTAVLQNAFDIVETHELNQIYLLSFSLPSTDEKNKFCLPRHFVRWGDDGELYRIKAPKTDENNVGVVTYECEHVITTLCDSVMFGSFQYGGAGVRTRATITWLMSQQKQQDWVLDVCDFDRKFEYLWEQENILNALYSIPKEFASPYMWTFDTTVYPWKISLRLLDTTKNPQYYLRARSNILSSGTAADYANICTRIYPLGYGEGVNQLNIKDVNNGVPYIQSPKAITDKYGIVEKVLVDRRFENAESLKAYAQSMLEVYQEPTMSRTFDVTDLYPLTGQDWTDAEVGKICKMTQDGSISYITRTKRQHDKAGDLHIDLSTKPTDIASNVADLADRVRIESVYAQGATQLYQHSKDANATTSKGMVMSLYFPSEMRQINKVLMRLKLGKFRSYSQATDSKTVTVKTCSNETVTVKTNPAALGGQKTTSDGGGTTSSSGGTSVSVSGGGSSGNGTDQMTTGLSLDVSAEGLVSPPMASQTSPPSTDTTSGTEWAQDYTSTTTEATPNGAVQIQIGDPNGKLYGNTWSPSGTDGYHSHSTEYWESGTIDGGYHDHDTYVDAPYLQSGEVVINNGYYSQSGKEHIHYITKNALAHSHNINHYHTVSVFGGASGGYHTHTFSVPNHTHTISAHSHSLPDLSHSHDFKLNGHTHSITLNSHSHDITPGIFENGNPTSFDIYVGGKKKTTVNSTSYDGDITTWLLNDKNQIPRNSWIDVEIRPNDLAYVQCSVFVQGFVQSRGGGNY